MSQLTFKHSLWLLAAVCCVSIPLISIGFYVGMEQPSMYWTAPSWKTILTQSDRIARQFEAIPRLLVTDDHDSRG